MVYIVIYLINPDCVNFLINGAAFVILILKAQDLLSPIVALSAQVFTF